MLAIKILNILGLASLCLGYKYTIALRRWSDFGCPDWGRGAYDTVLVREDQGCVDFPDDPPFNSESYVYVSQGADDRPADRADYCKVTTYTGHDCTGSARGADATAGIGFCGGSNFRSEGGSKSVQVECWANRNVAGGFLQR
ncbi:hypothetical protein LTR36_010022 [Oleoguttula mirabilis]|uniref:Uncharacterized protein n=1 Tax=Oleoguttula mirabilis TaxID=1507867 RepID=A0AAV9JRQ4_9PEZI|nr:hypothetical protein LTR36_010022 [Oleoguttula mirabilis]